MIEKNLWEQVPGQWFRRDNTPETMNIKSLLNLEQLDSNVGKLIAEELEWFVKEGGDVNKLERKLNLEFELGNSENIQPL